jgi:tetratricopeptide (TPR) repeat protein
MDNLGFNLKEQDRFDEAKDYFLKAVNGRRELLGDCHPETLHSTIFLAECMSYSNLSEAVPLARKAAINLDKVLGSDHEFTYDGMSVLGWLLWKQGDFDEAEDVLRKSLEVNSHSCTAGDTRALGNMQNLSLVLRDKGLLDEAEDYIKKVIAWKSELWGSGHSYVLAAEEISRSIVEAKMHGGL